VESLLMIRLILVNLMKLRVLKERLLDALSKMKTVFAKVKSIMANQMSSLMTNYHSKQ
jgi:hypothetical protein